jgi:hypothetical protein
MHVRYRIEADDLQPMLAHNAEVMDAYVRHVLDLGCPLHKIKISVYSYMDSPAPGLFPL